MMRSARYRSEMRSMLRHRKEYYPAIKYLVRKCMNATAGTPAVITDIKKMAILAELVEIGYLDNNSVVIISRFDEIEKIVCHGLFPLTESGEGYFRAEEKRARRTMKIAIAAVACAVVAGAVFAAAALN